MNRKRSRKGRKVYRVDLTPSRAFLFTLVFFFVLGWIFLLGIFVGRGSIPSKLANMLQLDSPLEPSSGSASHDGDSGLRVVTGPIEKPPLAFYERLPEEDVTEPAPAPSKRRSARKPPPPSAPERQDDPSSQGFSVQVAALENEAKAGAMVASLIDRGYRAYYYKAVRNEKIYFRVRCGPFQERSKAEKLKGTLAARERIQGFVVYSE